MYPRALRPLRPCFGTVSVLRGCFGLVVSAFWIQARHIAQSSLRDALLLARPVPLALLLVSSWLGWWTLNNGERKSLKPTKDHMCAIQHSTNRSRTASTDVSAVRVFRIHSAKQRLALVSNGVKNDKVGNGQNGNGNKKERRLSRGLATWHAEQGMGDEQGMRVICRELTFLLVDRIVTP
ncbi:hypothetical protein MIND_01420900 [Mycena indigotica]|uniref:Uncharacterized protein n=1 Tax=Mycena indigotica TaxID=2126181 RepID=A0A8H6RVV6_9AGAR|nr:uncharacterized protein MIND_01420900 [Mycena indigotica]KAF7288755.1 hypothetical protein MIND_01420900 [Mycena indigotica]